MTDRVKIGCAILAGGNNLRVGGEDKAFIEIGGIPIIERIFAAINSLFDEVLVISNRPEAYSRFQNVQVRPDKIPGKGPLGGLYTALHFTTSDALFILACDMPYINPGMIRTLRDLYRKSPGNSLVPRHSAATQPAGSHRLEPLFSIYPHSLLPLVESLVFESKELSMIGFLQKISTTFYDLPEDEETISSFMNLNTGSGELPYSLI